MIREVLSANTAQHSGKSVLEPGEGTKAAQVLSFVDFPHALAIAKLCNTLNQSL
jgi:hypothetical protein